MQAMVGGKDLSLQATCAGTGALKPKFSRHDVVGLVPRLAETRAPSSSRLAPKHLNPHFHRGTVDTSDTHTAVHDSKSPGGLTLFPYSMTTRIWASLRMKDGYLPT